MVEFNAPDHLNGDLITYLSKPPLALRPTPVRESEIDDTHGVHLAACT